MKKPEANSSIDESIAFFLNHLEDTARQLARIRHGTDEAIAAGNSEASTGKSRLRRGANSLRACRDELDRVIKWVEAEAN